MNEDKYKHLEFIHNTISRMSSHSFIVKGWYVTLFIALFVISEPGPEKELLIASSIAVCLFWYLNGFLLQQERKFRGLYDEVRITDVDEVQYSMEINHFKRGRYALLSSMFSVAVWPFYLPVLILLILEIIVGKM